ncbi:hypothetical protein EYC84_002594 [Monilinia fructicola]|uniref:Uncharacterized protein n=1 Tax=Monilinia fructicola TaxID=38448 RepID=A0A5M9JNK3_MONFR|nr:hypothetical protein EYC84_002594 [Monilinia fructicola]
MKFLLPGLLLGIASLPHPVIAFPNLYQDGVLVQRYSNQTSASHSTSSAISSKGSSTSTFISYSTSSISCTATVTSTSGQPIVAAREPCPTTITINYIPASVPYNDKAAFETYTSEKAGISFSTQASILKTPANTIVPTTDVRSSSHSASEALESSKPTIGVSSKASSTTVAFSSSIASKSSEQTTLVTLESHSNYTPPPSVSATSAASHTSLAGESAVSKASELSSEILFSTTLPGGTTTTQAFTFTASQAGSTALLDLTKSFKSSASSVQTDVLNSESSIVPTSPKNTDSVSKSELITSKSSNSASSTTISFQPSSEAKVSRLNTPSTLSLTSKSISKFNSISSKESSIFSTSKTSESFAQSTHKSTSEFSFVQHSASSVTTSISRTSEISVQSTRDTKSGTISEPLEEVSSSTLTSKAPESSSVLTTREIKSESSLTSSPQVSITGFLTSKTPESTSQTTREGKSESSSAVSSAISSALSVSSHKTIPESKTGLSRSTLSVLGISTSRAPEISTQTESTRDPQSSIFTGGSQPSLVSSEIPIQTTKPRQSQSNHESTSSLSANRSQPPSASSQSQSQTTQEPSSERQSKPIPEATTSLQGHTSSTTKPSATKSHSSSVQEQSPSEKNSKTTFHSSVAKEQSTSELKVTSKTAEGSVPGKPSDTAPQSTKLSSSAQGPSTSGKLPEISSTSVRSTFGETSKQSTSIEGASTSAKTFATPLSHKTVSEVSSTADRQSETSISSPLTSFKSSSEKEPTHTTKFPSSGSVFESGSAKQVTEPTGLPTSQVQTSVESSKPKSSQSHSHSAKVSSSVLGETSTELTLTQTSVSNPSSTDMNASVISGCTATLSVVGQVIPVCPHTITLESFFATSKASASVQPTTIIVSTSNSITSKVAETTSSKTPNNTFKISSATSNSATSNLVTSSPASKSPDPLVSASKPDITTTDSFSKSPDNPTALPVTSNPLDPSSTPESKPANTATDVPHPESNTLASTALPLTSHPATTSLPDTPSSQKEPSKLPGPLTSVSSTTKLPDASTSHIATTIFPEATTSQPETSTPVIPATSKLSDSPVSNPGTTKLPGAPSSQQGPTRSIDSLTSNPVITKSLESSSTSLVNPVTSKLGNGGDTSKIDSTSAPTSHVRTETAKAISTPQTTTSPLVEQTTNAPPSGSTISSSVAPPVSDTAVYSLSIITYIQFSWVNEQCATPGTTSLVSLTGTKPADVTTNNVTHPGSAVSASTEISPVSSTLVSAPGTKTTDATQLSNPDDTVTGSPVISPSSTGKYGTSTSAVGIPVGLPTNDKGTVLPGSTGTADMIGTQPIASNLGFQTGATVKGAFPSNTNSAISSIQISPTGAKTNPDVTSAVSIQTITPTTIKPSPGQTTIAPVIVNSLTLSQKTSDFIIGSQTIKPGSEATVSGERISIASSGSAIIINGATTSSPVSSSTPNSDKAVLSTTTEALPGVAVLGTSSVTADFSKSVFVFGSATLTRGGAITQGSTIITLPASTAPPLSSGVIVIGSSTYTKNSASGIIIGSQTLKPGSVITVDGSTLSLSPTGNAVVVNANSGFVTQTASLASVVPVSSLVIGGQTLTAGGTVTEGGDIFESGSGWDGDCGCGDNDGGGWGGDGGSEEEEWGS